MKTEYSPAEANMVLCSTRERSCTPEECLRCGWLRNDLKKSLNKSQREWEQSEEGTDGKTV